MSNTGDQVAYWIPEKVVVGLSSIIGLTSIPGQNSLQIKYGSGGSLEIGSTVIGLGASPFTWGVGYLMGTSEVLYGSLNSMVYLAATGATVTCYVIRGVSPGALTPNP